MPKYAERPSAEELARRADTDPTGLVNELNILGLSLREAHALVTKIEDGDERASNQAAPRAVVDAWSAPRKPTREQIQEQVVARATRSRGLPVRVGGDALPVVPSRHASLPLQRLPPLGVPAPISARPGVSLLKQLVRRATAWQVDPLVAQVNALRQATIEALEHSAQPDREPPAEARLGKVR